jgi:hypothetical protein
MLKVIHSDIYSQLQTHTHIGCTFPKSYWRETLNTANYLQNRTQLKH